MLDNADRIPFRSVRLTSLGELRDTLNLGNTMVAPSLYAGAVLI